MIFPEPARASVLLKLPSGLGLASGLVGYWTMDGKDINWTANTMTDKSGNGNTGTITNMSTTTSPTIGKIGQALNFDGTDDYVYLGAGSTFNFSSTNAFTISAWVNTPADVTQSNIFARGSSANSADGTIYYLGRQGTSWTTRVSDGTTRITLTSGTVPANQWTHVVVTWNGSTKILTLYQNSAVVTTATDAAFTTLWDGNDADDDNTSIGADTRSTIRHFWQGNIDEVRVYNRALSAQEVKQLYGAGQAKVKPVGPVDESLPANAFVAYVRENCTGYSPCYNTLSAWEAAAGGITYGACATGDLVCADKVAVAKIDGSWTSPDTAAVTISGWTTDATRYIKIYTTPSARHDGKWNTTKYHRTETITVSEEYVRIDGLQSEVTGSARGYFVYGST